MARTLDKEYIYNNSSPAGQREVKISATYQWPVVVMIQHGGWQTVPYSDSWMEPWNDAFRDEGFSTIRLNWRFAPGSTYNTALADIDSAIRFAYAKIVNFNKTWGRALETPINVIGMSSGAHLAVSWALNRAVYSKQAWRPGLVSGVVGLAGAYDLADGTLNETATGFINDFLADPTWTAEASPITHAPMMVNDVTKYFLIHGEDDELLPIVTQAQAMHTAMAATDANKTGFLSYADIGHEIGQYTSTGWEGRLNTILHFFRTGEMLPEWLLP